MTLAGTLVVHHGRYLAAPPANERELAGVHHYLAWLTPLVAAFAFLAVVQFGSWLSRAHPFEAPRLPSARWLWLAATACLLVAFTTQEVVEELLAGAPPPALGEIFGEGGWIVAPIAGALGIVLALLLKGAARVARWVLRRRAATAPRRLGPWRVVLPWAPPRVSRTSVLARRLAGRAPPALS